MSSSRRDQHSIRRGSPEDVLPSSLAQSTRRSLDLPPDHTRSALNTALMVSEIPVCWCT